MPRGGCVFLIRFLYVSVVGGALYFCVVVTLITLMVVFASHFLEGHVIFICYMYQKIW